MSRSLISIFSFLLATTSFATDQISIRITSEPETLDWNLSRSQSEALIHSFLMEGLTRYNEKSELVNSLAEHYELQDEDTKIIFNLRSNVVWSDGVRLTAQHFVDSWKRLLSPLSKASYAYLLFDVVGAEDFSSGKLTNFEQVGIKALSETRLEVKLKRAVRDWASVTSFCATFPIRKDLVDQHGTQWTWPGRLVSLGAYTLEAKEERARVTLKRNTRYHGKKQPSEKLDFLVLTEEGQALDLFKKEKVDIIYDFSAHPDPKTASVSKVVSTAALKTTYFGFVTTQYPVSLPAVRKAIASGIRKNKVVNDLVMKGIEAKSWLPPSIPGCKGNFVIPYNVDKSRALFRNSGLTPDRKWSIEFITTDWTERVKMAKAIQSELTSSLSIEMPFQALGLQAFRSQLDLKNYPAFLARWTADFPNIESFLTVFLSTSGNNFTGWKNAEYDKAVNELIASNSSVARETLCQKALKILLEDEVVIVPLFHDPNRVLYRKSLGNVRVNNLGILFL